MKTKSFPPHIESVHQIQKFITDALPAGSATPELSGRVALIMEEIVVNIITHGFAEQPDGMIDVDVDIRDRDICITISDNGVAFNPLESKDPDIDADLADREIGGLGLYFLKKMTRDVRYSRAQGQNILVLVF